MLVERGDDIAADGLDLEALLARILYHALDQPGSHAPAADGGRDDRVFGHPHAVALHPGQASGLVMAFEPGVVFTVFSLIVRSDRDFAGHACSLDCLTVNACVIMAVPMQFLSDNAAPVHPAVWEALRAADEADAPYDNDFLSRRLDEAFGGLFGCEVAALWVATGTAANCLALAPMVPPHGGVVCHREAHIEVDEAGAPGFYLHGAKLILAEGEGARLTPGDIEAAIDPIRDDVHQVQPHALSVTQTSEYGRAYSPGDMSALARFARERGLGFHVDGARFANAVAHLDCLPREACAGSDVLSFGFVKNGGMGAEAIVFFDPALADVVRYRRKRAGHLQSKGRFLAAQILAMLDDDLWLRNARAANAAAAEIAGACGSRLMHPVEANELFVRLSSSEREWLRASGFSFYDWGEDAARFVTAWNTRAEDAAALAKAIAEL